jgi:DNA helicase-2/ATP-dependent DNA helicase PcrA
MRAGHHSDLLELELGRRRIPFVKYGGIRYLETAHVKDLLALFRVAANPGDELAWFRLLQLLDGVGPVAARRLADELLGGNPPPAEYPARWDAADVPAAARATGRGLLDAIAASSAEGVGVPQQVDVLLRGLAPVVRAAYSDGDTRLFDLEQLAAAASTAPSVSRFVAEIVLDPPLSSSDWAGPPGLDEDYLVLSTIHSAKGLEWEHVHLIHASDGNVPADMALSTPEGLEEERRLFYVAVTRPRRSLHIYVPRRYYHRPTARDDPHGYGKPSRFLTERLRRLCDAVQAGEEPDASPASGAPRPRIEVSLDHLW